MTIYAPGTSNENRTGTMNEPVPAKDLLDAPLLPHRSDGRTTAYEPKVLDQDPEDSADFADDGESAVSDSWDAVERALAKKEKADEKAYFKEKAKDKGRAAQTAASAQGTPPVEVE